MAWAPDYVSSEALDWYNRNTFIHEQNVRELAVSSASRAIDQFTGRQFGLVDAPEARYYTARWDRKNLVWGVEIDDLMTTTDLAVALDDDTRTWPNTVSSSYYAVIPRNAASKDQPWTSLTIFDDSPYRPTGVEHEVKITASWGWSGVPDTIQKATLLQAARFLIRRDSPYGIAGSATNGSEMRLLSRVDPDVEVMLRPYIRRWWAR